MQIVEAASELCDILWLLDESAPDGAFTSRLLRKLGTVVNVAGSSTEETALLLRPYSPDGVVAYRDEDIVLLSLIAAELGLEYRTPEVARRLVGQALAARCAPPGWTAFAVLLGGPRRPEPCRASNPWPPKVKYPAVLKPRIGNGGQYTMPVATAGDLLRSVTLLPPEAGGETGMFVEQFIPSLSTAPEEGFGSYVSVESLVAGGEISHLAVTGRFPLAEPFRETGFFIPADLSQAQLAEVLAVTTAALHALGVRTGDCHTELKLTPGRSPGARGERQARWRDP